ncbi:MAG: AI-2E family transporter [Clostridium sp.]|nr:AI-2E family transporter [Clostridium sp.]
MDFLKKYKKLIDLILLFVFIFIITILIKTYLRPFISMTIIYIVSSPIYRILQKFNIPNKVSAVLSVFIVNLLLMIIIIYLGNSIYCLGKQIYDNNIKHIEIFFSYIKNLLKHINIDFSNKSVFSFFNNDLIKSKAINTGEELISYFIGNISAFFLLIDIDKIKKLIKNIMPIDFILKFYNEKESIKQMIVIEGMLVIISTLEIIVGFMIFKVPKAFMFGIVCGILDILPYVGTIIVFIPIIIYNIILREYLRAFGLIFLFILVQVIREILEAKFLSDKLDLHPLLILLSIYIGVKIFGMLGIIIGPMYGILAKGIVYSD